MTDRMDEGSNTIPEAGLMRMTLTTSPKDHRETFHVRKKDHVKHDNESNHRD